MEAELGRSTIRSADRGLPVAVHRHAKINGRRHATGVSARFDGLRIEDGRTS